MLGRFVAILIAVFLMVMLPIKYRGITEAKRTENIIFYMLDSFIRETEDSGKIELNRLNDLRRNLSAFGLGYGLEIEIGTVIHYHGKSSIDVVYTEEILKMLDDALNNEIYVGGKLVSVKVPVKRESFELKLANLFWDSYIPDKKMTAGGYIHG